MSKEYHAEDAATGEFFLDDIAALHKRIGELTEETERFKAAHEQTVAAMEAAQTEAIERVSTELRNWIGTANHHARNEEYYRGLVVQIGEMIGPSAYISDDGSVQEDVLCAKVPELVARLVG